MRCKRCGQSISKELLAKERAKRKRKIRASLKSAKERGIHIGRPRGADPQVILYFRHAGLSISSIAKYLQISRGAVQYSLRKKNLT